MSDFKQSECDACEQNKACKSAVAEFAAELCPKAKETKDEKTR